MTADPIDVAAEFTARLERSALTERTVDAYGRYATQFCEWLDEQGPQYAGALSDEHLRDYAARDWRRHLIDRGASAATITLALTSVGRLYQHLGMGKPRLRGVRSRAGQPTPKALSADEQVWVMRAAQRRGPRDLALVAVGMFAGLRVAEIVGLDRDDVWVSERKGTVQVRHGKGTTMRSVPLPSQAREAVAPWLLERARIVTADQALFVATRGAPARLTTRAVQKVVTKIGEDAKLEQPLSPHMLRHTCATNMLHRGADLPTVGLVLGHASLDTTRIYTNPTAEWTEQAMEAVTIDY